MKKGTLCLLTILMLVLSAGSVFAAETSTVAEVGLKGWYNEWKQERNGQGSVTSDSTLMIGPEVAVKLPSDVFLGASYLFTTSDYRFSDVTGTSDVERQDFDFVIGYLFVPQFGIATGYRTLWFKDNAGLKETVYGPIFGIRVQGALGEQFSLYGKADYQFTKFEEQDEFGTFRENSPGWIVEAGFQYAFTRTFSATLGYKYETNKGNTSDVRDTFTGLTFGAFLSL